MLFCPAPMGCSPEKRVTSPELLRFEPLALSEIT